MPKPTRVQPPADLTTLRKRILTAVASDDVLVELLVLKGGNALELIHRIGDRASLDLDFSMKGDVEDSADLERRLKRGVEDRLDAAGYVVFDWKFGPRPTNTSGKDARWGGYRAEFKLIERDTFRDMGGDIEALRRNAQVIGSHQERTFVIDISKFEFCNGSVLADVDHFECHVYTPAMIAAEKLRAICQQMPEYLQRKHGAPRPRDFYDIHAIATIANVRLGDHIDLVRDMFEAKDVPHALIPLIGRGSELEFHRQQWEAVVQSVRGEVREFEFYFEFVVRETQSLEPLWKVNSPIG